MILHNESGKWLKWSEARAKRQLAAGQTLVVHQFPAQRMCCIWFA